uniref:Uncharacterized protein n=1 Tax=Arundo donax TaxID=35708 RepID=A0A0A9DJ77_ARUDO
MYSGVLYLRNYYFIDLFKEKKILLTSLFINCGIKYIQVMYCIHAECFYSLVFYLVFRYQIIAACMELRVAPQLEPSDISTYMYT